MPEAWETYWLKRYITPRKMRTQMRIDTPEEVHDKQKAPVEVFGEQEALVEAYIEQKSPKEVRNKEFFFG